MLCVHNLIIGEITSNSRRFHNHCSLCCCFDHSEVSDSPHILKKKPKKYFYRWASFVGRVDEKCEKIGIMKSRTDFDIFATRTNQLKGALNIRNFQWIVSIFHIDMFHVFCEPWTSHPNSKICEHPSFDDVIYLGKCLRDVENFEDFSNIRALGLGKIPSSPLCIGPETEKNSEYSLQDLEKF